jgi:hypothetical protein
MVHDCIVALRDLKTIVECNSLKVKRDRGQVTRLAGLGYDQGLKQVEQALTCVNVVSVPGRILPSHSA